MENLSKKQLLEEVKRLSAENARLNHEMTLMRQKMDLLIRRMFGRSSEKMDAGQLDLFSQPSHKSALMGADLDLKPVGGLFCQIMV